VPAAALVLVLLAAGAHAAWNVLAKTASGGAAFVWLFTAAATVIYVPVVAVAMAIDPAPVDGIPHINLDLALDFLIGDKLR